MADPAWDGVAVVRHLLANDEGVLALVDAEADPPRIAGDVLGEGVQAEAIRIWKVSGTDRQVLKPRGKRRVTQRVQVDALAPTVARAKTLHRAVRHACANAILAELGPLTRVVVLTAGEGPQGIDAATMLRVEQQDFMVSFNEEL